MDNQNIDKDGRLWIMRLRGYYYGTDINTIVRNPMAAVKYVTNMESMDKPKGFDKQFPHTAIRSNRKNRRDWLWNYPHATYTAEWEEVFE